MRLITEFSLLAASQLVISAAVESIPDPPAAEPITVVELPLPPVSASNATGACTTDLNPNGTGCMGITVDAIQSGDFLPDGKHVLVEVNFIGAPTDNSTASTYSGHQIIIVKIDNTTFSNGDSYKCLTCGVPAANSVGEAATYDYPQAFHDGKRLLFGSNILECDSLLTSDECTPETTLIYPIRWGTTADGSGATGSMRELRIHPDNVHLGWSSAVAQAGSLNQYCYLGRLSFNAKPTTGLPLSPRYDLTNVTILVAHDEPTLTQPFLVNGTQLTYNPDAITIGELRGFNGDGTEVTYVGYSTESTNMDVYAADLTTGAVRRLTSHPEYCDPMAVSRDNEWMVIDDTRGTNRQMFMAGMRGVPPIIDMVATTAAASTRNNGVRRFFNLYLLDRWGDRGDYYGQKVNAAGSGVPGSGAINDPEWNVMADPRFSPDGTRIAYWQAFVVSPACGGTNPLPCYNSTAAGGRATRLMLATLTSRSPKTPETPAVISDDVPWAHAYVPGSAAPSRPLPAEGNYTIYGLSSGFAAVQILEMESGGSLKTVSVKYSDYSDDGENFINGDEQVTRTNPSYTLEMVDWYSNLTRNGTDGFSTKKTSDDGFHLTVDALINNFEANGTLTTTVDGIVYEQPVNGG